MRQNNSLGQLLIDENDTTLHICQWQQYVDPSVQYLL